MKSQVFLIIIWISTYCCPFAQESVASENENACTDPMFCNKGVAGMCDGKFFSYRFEMLPKFDLKSKSDEQEIGSASANVKYVRRTKAKLKVPLVNKKSLKMVLGFKYAHQEYRFSDPSGLNYELYKDLEDKSLKSIGTAVYLFKPINDKFYIVAKTGVNFNGDYSRLQFKKEHLFFSEDVAFGWKKSSDIELGLGISYSYGLGYHTAYPIILYNHTFNDQWGIESALPVKAHVRYNVTPKTLLFAGAKVDGNNYHVNAIELGGTEDEYLRMRDKEVKLGVRLEQQIYDPIWFGFEIGYRNSLGVDFSRTSDSKSDFLIKATPGSGMFTNISLFLTVPKNLLGKLKKSCKTSS